ncbi:hypothetical protein PTKIN_Ptkin06aG0013700 [Pterospermum kingtungense]
MKPLFFALYIENIVHLYVLLYMYQTGLIFSLSLTLFCHQSPSHFKEAWELTKLESSDSTMASFKFPLFLFLYSLFLHASLAAEINCEELPKGVCAFAIASSGKRCVLETAVEKGGNVVYQCRTSEVVVERMSEYIETDECVSACGVDRNSIGISSDSLLEPQLTAKLCAPACYQKCPNIVDLYFNLAAGEGPKLET